VNTPVFTYAATLNGVFDLPNYISYNNGTSTFTMLPSSAYGSGGIYPIIVTATLENEQEVSTQFNIIVDNVATTKMLSNVKITIGS
jgi:hypothetical protein